MSKLTRAVLPLLAVCLPLTAAYPIRLSRPERVGCILLVQADGRQIGTSKVTVNGQSVQGPPDTSTVIHLTYKSEILEVDDIHKTSKLRITMGKGNCLINGAVVALPPEGTVLELKEEHDKNVFRKDGIPLPDQVQGALGIVIKLEESHDDDIQFGTTTPKEVGDSWNVSGEGLLATAGKEIGLVGDSKKISGKSRVEALQKDEGVDCLKVSTHADIPDVRSVFFIDKESGLKLDKGNFVVDQEVLLPIDINLQAHAYKMHTKFDGLCSADVNVQDKILPMKVNMAMEEWESKKMTILVR